MIKSRTLIAGVGAWAAAAISVFADPMPYDSIAHPLQANPISDTSIQTRVDVANLTMNPVRVNQAGYRLVDVQESRAQFYVVGTTLPIFQVIDPLGAVVATGSLSSTGLSTTGSVKSERTIDAARSPNPMYRGYPKTGAAFSGSVWVGTIPATVPPGRYQIKTPLGTSVPFVVSANLYGMVRDATIKFFGIQRAGSLADETGLITDTLYSPSWFRSKPAHTWDGWNIDTSGAGAAKYRYKGKLSGGWYDCGDHLKETRTQSFALAILGVTAATMPEKDADSYGFNHNDTRRTDGIPDIVREARWGAQYALKAWRVSGGSMTGSTVDSTRLYLSVGDFGKDHGWWGQPQNQDVVVPDRGGRQNRPARVDYGSASLADWAAGLAFVSRLYRPFDRTGWSDTTLKAARDLYELAKKVNRLESSPAYNGESRSQDDLALASTALFWATREKKYLDETILTPGLPNGGGGTCGGNQAATFPGSHFEGGFFGCTSDQMRKSGANTDWASVQSVALYSFFKLFLQNKDTAAAYGINDAQRGLLAQRTVANLMANLSARSQSTAGQIRFPQIGRSGMDVSYNLLNHDSLWYTMQTQQEWVWNRYQMGNLAELYMYWDMTRYLDPSQITLPDLPTPVWQRDKLEKALVNGTGVILGMNQWDMSMLLGVGAKNPGHPHHRAANPEGKNVPGANYNYRIPVGALYGGITPGSATTQLFEQWENWRITETCLDGSAVTLLALTGLAENVPNEAPKMDVKVLNTTDTLALVQVDLDKWGTVKLEYGTDSLLTGPITTVLGKDTSNSILLRIHRLAPSTKYWFKVTATDLAGKSRTQWAWVGSPTDSVRYNFTTKALPLPPAVYGMVKACNVTSDSADIMWYTPNGEYLSSVMFADSANWKAGNYRYVNVDQSGPAPVRFHHVRLYGLKERTTYYFRVGEPGGPYDDEVGCFRTPITDYKFKVYAGQYTEGSGFPMLSLNVVNEEERTFDSLSLRFYVRSTDTLWKSPGVPYTVLGPTPTLDPVPLTFENSIGVKYDICQAYNSAGYNRPCDDIFWGLNWSWGNLSTGVFMLKPVKIPGSYDPATNTWAYYLEMPLGPTVMNSQSRIRFDARLVARSEWPNPINQGNIDAFNFANSFVNRTVNVPTLGDRQWWDEAGPNRASLGHTFVTRQDAPLTTTDWSWMPHSVATGSPVNYPGMLRVAKDSFDIIRPEEAVNPFVAVYRKGVFVYGFSPDKKEQATKRTVFAMDVKYDAPFDVSNGGTINLESSASSRLTGTVDVYDQLIPTAKGFVTGIWVNGVELTPAQRRAAVSRNPNGTWKLDLPLRLYTGTNKVDVTIFAGADSTEAVTTNTCDEGRPCAFKNSFWFVNSISKLTPSQIAVFDASANPASKVTPDSSIVRVRVTDGNANKNSATADVVTVRLVRGGVASGTLTLVETGIATGIFELPVSVVSGTAAANQVKVLPGDTLVFSYQDADDAEDTVSAAIFAVSSWPTPERGGIFRSCGGTYEARVRFDRALSGGATLGAELVKDGGFEAPAISSQVVTYSSGSMGGWTVTNVDMVRNTYLSTNSGLQSIDLSSTMAGSVSQTLASVAGQPLQLSLAWTYNNTVAGAPSAVIFWNGTPIDTLRAMLGSARGWKPYSRSLVAAGNDRLEFRSLANNQYGIMLDDISVRQVSGASGSSNPSSVTVVLRNGPADSTVLVVPPASTTFDAATRTLTIPLAGVPESGLRTGRAEIAVSDASGAVKVLSQALADSVGPWLDSIKIVENLEARLVDTVVFWASEPVMIAKAWPFAVVRGGSTLAAGVLDSVWEVDDKTNKWMATVRGGLRAGDQARFLPGVTDARRNAALECPSLLRTVAMLVRPVPVSRAWIRDTDGDGRANEVVVVFRRVLRANEIPESIRAVFGSADSVRIAAVSAPPGDSVVRIALPTPFGSAETRGSGFDGSGSLVMMKSGDASAPIVLADSVSPVLNSAILRYGSGGAPDTLVVRASEKLVVVDGAGFIVNRRAPNAGMVAISGASADGTTWRLVLEPTSLGYPFPGDEIRLPAAGSRLVASNGTVPGINNPWVVVRGGDRPPRAAWYEDADGDGRVDRATLEFARPLSRRPAFLFAWPNASGTDLDTVVVDSTAYMLAPSGLRAVIDLPDPFAFGVTSCDALRFPILGTMLQNNEGIVDAGVFAVADSVDPVLLAASIRYASGDGVPDTLRVRWSEPLAWTNIEPLLVRRDKQDRREDVHSAGVAVHPDRLGADLQFVPGDNRLTNFHRGDSLRLAPASKLTVTDLLGNAAEDPTHWVALLFGARPPRFDLEFDPRMLKYEGWPVPTSGPEIQLQVRARGDSAWQTLDGSAPAAVAHTIGPVLSLNQPLRGTVVIYDKAGIYVASADLTAIEKLIASGAFEPDPSGMYQIRLAWNGRAVGGNLAASGVFTMRLVLYQNTAGEGEEPQYLMSNRLYNFGWYVPSK